MVGGGPPERLLGQGKNTSKGSLQNHVGVVAEAKSRDGLKVTSPNKRSFGARIRDVTGMVRARPPIAGPQSSFAMKTHRRANYAGSTE